MSSMSTDDGILLARWARERDAEAFKAIVDRYAGVVYGTCRRLLGDPTEAEDAAQECFEALVQQGTKPKMYLGAWLHRVARNRALTRLRGERRRKEREDKFARALDESSEIVWDDIYAYVDEAVEGLPEHLRIPVVAHFLAGETHDSIARQLGLTRQGVTYRVGQGVDRIRERLRSKGVPIASAALATLLGAKFAEAAPASLVNSLGRLALVGPVAAPGVGLLAALKVSASLKAVLAGVTLVAAGGAAYLAYNAPPDERQAAVAAVAKQEPSSHPSQAAEAKPDTPQVSQKPESSTTAKAAATDALTGTVSTTSGDPIAGANVTASNGQAEDDKRTTADAAGRFSLALNADVYNYRIAFDAPGYLPLAFDFHPFIREAQVELRVKLDKGLDFSGQLMDSYGAPVCGARVSLVSSSSRPQSVTDSDGRFTVLSSADNPVLRFVHPSIGTYEYCVETYRQDFSELKIQASPVGILRLRVLRGSQPVPGARVEIGHGDDSGMPQKETDANGIAEMELNVTSKAMPSVTDAGGDIAVLVSGSTRVDAGNVSECTYEFPRYVASVSGKVLDPEGKPIGQSHVSILSERHPEAVRAVAAASDGSYRATLEEGKSTLRAYCWLKGRYVRVGQARDIVAAGSKAFVEDFRAEALEMTPPVFTVTMEDKEKNPVRHALLIPALPQSSRNRVEVLIHAAAGTFLLAGDCGLTVIDAATKKPVCLGNLASPGEPSCLYETGAGSVARIIREDPKSNALSARFETPACAIAGIVLDEAGTPLSDVSVTVFIRGRQPRFRQTDSEGRFRFDYLPDEGPCTLVLNCARPQFESRTTVKDVRAAASPEPLRIVIRSLAAEVAGVVVDEENVPAAGAIVRYTNADESEVSIEADEKGAFHVPLSRGQYAFWASGPHWEKGVVVPVTAPAGDVVLVMPKSIVSKETIPAPGDEAHTLRKEALQQISIVFKMFANESKGEIYPALASQFGAFMPDTTTLFPEYVSDPAIVASLTGRQDVKLCYFGYAIDKEAAAVVFLDAYEAYGPEGLKDQDLSVDEETAKELGGLEHIYRLREGIDRLFITDINDPNASIKAQSTLPVVWEMPTEKESAGWVLYLDGHTEWKEYGDFPITESTVTRVNALTATGRTRK